MEKNCFPKLNQLAIAKGYYYAQTTLKPLTNSVNWQIKVYRYQIYLQTRIIEEIKQRKDHKKMILKT
jgi:hypothetical protein